MIIKYNNKVVTHNDKWVGYESSEPLPPFTLRLRFSEGYTPTFSKGIGVQVSSSPNIWDLTYENSYWQNLLDSQTNCIEVIDGNTTGVTYMRYMFAWSGITTVSLFDTSNVTDMYGMFYHCSSLTAIPLFNTSSVTDMTDMFNACYQVQTGALALYNQASTQTTPPTEHKRTFKDCGKDTQTGLTELNQIPSSWGGNVIPPLTLDI